MQLQPAFSSRALRVKASPASILSQRARELRAAGRDVIVLTSGDLDFPTPPHVVAAAHDAAVRGDTKYTNVDGTTELKDAIRRKFKLENGVEYSKAEIIVCNGSKQAMFNALLATLEPGDEVIIPAPYWVSYVDLVLLADGKPVIVHCAPDNGFRLRPTDLAKAVGLRSRWFILNHPTNPTGVVYTEAELRAFADVITPYPQLRIMADDLYEHLRFDGRPFCTFAQAAPQMKARTLTVNGVSKGYAMMGWRIGYAAGSPDLIGEMIKIQSQSTSGASSIAQAASVAALNGPDDFLRARAEILADRRNLITSLVQRAPGLSCERPEGTFYLYASCEGIIGKRTPNSRVITSDRDFASYLLEAENVAVFPGEDCGGSPYFRLSFACEKEMLREAGTRIIRACTALQ